MSVSLSHPALRATAAILAAGTLLGAAATTATADPRPRRADVEISAVHPDVPGPDDRNNQTLNREWIELTNNSRRPVSLDGWTLSNRRGVTYTFEDFRLGGRDTVRVHTGFGRDTDSDVYQDRRREVWNDRDTATLRNDHRRVIDTESWGGRGHDRDDDDRGDRDNRGDRDHRGGRDGDHRGGRDGDHRGDRDNNRHGDRHHHRGDRHNH